MGRYLLIFSDAHDVIPQPLAVLLFPNISALKDGNEKLFRSLQEWQKACFLCLHNPPSIVGV